ncbi:MAG TPA: YkgJ family cysteine cluster protein [Haliangiales bacterium]|nr:YkgJ family cysteine cluster protein [Haliangiales bacterium]
MTDKERLQRLVAELVSDNGYLTGRRRFPRTVTVEDAVAVAAELQEGVDAGTAQRDASARSRRITIACGAGCDSCCSMPIMVFLPEALRVAAWLRLPENAETLARFEAAYPAWRDACAAVAELIADATQAQDREGVVARVLDYWRMRVPCPFLREGLCSIYPARPNVCRAHHAVDTAANCVPDAPEPSRRMNFVPLDQFVDRARHIHLGLHHALGGPRQRTVALGQAVHDALGRG